MYKNFSGVACPLLGSLTVSGILIFSHNQVLAQVTPDDTLGDESSVVNTRDVTSDSIDGGAIRGQNLFHSFEEFNVDADRGVYFANPDAVTNIFSRVTGNDVSNILGTLGVDGAANLFLINPNGIIFEEGASLDVQGSFAATTADGIEFGEQGFFSASDPEAPKLLTINPSAYLFNQVAPGAIANFSTANNNGLQVQPGKSLSLIGGNVSLNGGIITAPAGNVDLGGLAALGKVSINSNGSLNFPESVARSNVFLTQEAFVDVSGTEGGNITVNAGDLEISSNSELQTGTFFETGSPGGQSGDITLNATDAVEIDASTLNSAVGIGNAGNIEISTASFFLTNDGLITNSTVGEGSAGNIIIDVDENVSLDTGDIVSNVGSEAEGDAGAITIDANSISLNNGAQIQSGVFEGGNGDGNNVTLNSRGNVTISSSDQSTSGIFTDVETKGNNNSGNININAQNSIILDDASLNSKNAGTGFSGDINLNAKNELAIINDSIILSDGFYGRIFLDSSNSSIEIKDSFIFNDSENNIRDSERFGKIQITSPQGSININNSSITTKNTGTGFAGDINLDALNQISSKNSRISAEGNFGRIFIGDSIVPLQVKLEGQKRTISKIQQLRTITENDSRFSFSNRLSTTNSNADDLAGKITINARDSINIIGSEIESRTETTRTTNIDNQDGLNFSTVKLKVVEENLAGTITINQSRISTTNSDIGFSGDVRLNAKEKIEILDTSIFSRGNLGRILIGKSDISGETSSPQEVNFNNSFLTVSNDSVTVVPETQINAGDILINAVNNISFDNSSEISTVTERQGNAGNLTIHSENGSVFLDQSNVFSNVNPGGIGNAGDINITASNSIYFTNGAELQSGIVANKINDDFVDSIPSGQGNGGNITLNAIESIILSDSNAQDPEDGSSIFTDVEETAIGNGGNIKIITGSLFLTDKAKLTTESLGFGNAGNIKIVADFISLDRDSSIFAANTPSADISTILSGGNINLQISDNLILRDSDISTQASINANGGNIGITADSIIAFDDSDIFASAADGQGGDITLDSPAYFAENFTLNSLTSDPDSLDNNSRADLNATGNQPGIVSIPDVSFIQNGLNNLPDNSINTDELVANSCVSPVGKRQEGKFIITGTGGLPVRPGNDEIADFATGEVRNVPSNNSGWQRGEPIVEPQGVYRLTNGKLVMSRECHSQ